MTRINSTPIIEQNGFQTGVPMVGNHAMRNHSESSLRGGCGQIISTPWQWVQSVFSWVTNFLNRWVFCCCSFRFGHNIQWRETREILEQIYTQIITSKTTSPVKIRQEKLSELFSQLSESAQERFREHIGFQLALRQSPPIEDRADQIVWFKHNREQINFARDYFLNVGENNQVLEAAIEAFHEEALKKA